MTAPLIGSRVQVGNPEVANFAGSYEGVLKLTDGTPLGPIAVDVNRVGGVIFTTTTPLGTVRGQGVVDNFGQASLLSVILVNPRNPAGPSALLSLPAIVQITPTGKVIRGTFANIAGLSGTFEAFDNND